MKHAFARQGSLHKKYQKIPLWFPVFCSSIKPQKMRWLSNVTFLSINCSLSSQKRVKWKMIFHNFLPLSQNYKWKCCAQRSLWKPYWYFKRIIQNIYIYIYMYTAVYSLVFQIERSYLEEDSTSIPQLQRGFNVFWKLFWNMCSLKWLKPRRSLVISFIPVIFWQL